MAAGGLAMAGAAGLIVAIGNAYTLDIGQIVTQPGVAATAGSALANSGVAAVPSNHRPPPSMSGGATAHGSVRNGAHLDVRRVSAALLTLRDATEAEMSDPQASTDDADAPGVLVPAIFQGTGAGDDALGGGTGAADDGFPAGLSGAGGFGPPTGGGGFLPAPSSPTGASAGVNPQLSDTGSQGIQPLQDLSGLAGPVPEPGVWIMLIFGLGGVGAAMRMRQPGRARYPLTTLAANSSFALMA